MRKFILLSTSACHLCDQAKAAILPVIAQYDIRLTEVDIASDDRLIDLYGTRIPVIKNHKDVELDWPFTQAQLLKLISD